MYFADKELAIRYGVSRQTIWRLAKLDPKFPKPIRLSPGSTRWLLSELEAWEASKRNATN